MKKIIRKYTILFGLFIFIVVWGLRVQEKTLLLYGDSTNQYFPVMCYMRNYLIDFIKQLLQGNFQPKYFDFSIGFGEDVIQSLNYYGFGDIFMLLTIFFPEQNMVECYSFLILLKVYISGIAFIYYWKDKADTRNEAIAISAFMYTTSAFVLLQGISFPQFLNVMITFPFFLLGIEEIESGKKWSKTLSVVVFIQALQGFYFLYMETISMALWFLCRYAYGKVRTYRRFFSQVKSIASSYLIGLFMGAVIFIPTIYGFLTSSRTSAVTTGTVLELLFDKNWLLIIKDMVIPSEGTEGLALPMIGVIAIIMYFMKFPKSPYKMFSLFALISIFFPVVGIVMNGFSYSTIRWYFIVYFLVSGIMLQVLPQMEKVTKYILMISGIVCMMLLLVWGYGRTNIRRLLVYSITYLSVLGILLTIIYIGKLKYIYLFCAANIIGHVLLFWFSMGDLGLGLSSSFWNKEDAQKLVSFSKNIEKEEFYRVDKSGECVNWALISGVYSTSSYLSICNKNVSEFYQEYMISPATWAASFVRIGLDHRNVLRDVLSVKYYEHLSNMNTNTTKLPLGYTYHNYITRKEFERYNPIERTALLLKAAVVEDEDEYKMSVDKTKVNIEMQKIKFQETYENIEELDEKQIQVTPDSEIKLNFTTHCDGEVYIIFRGLKTLQGGMKNIYVGDNILKIRSIEDIYYMGIDDYMVKVGDYLQGEHTVVIGFEGADMILLDMIDIYLYPEEVYTMDREIFLESDILENINVANNQISGNIDCCQKELLFLSIPYSSGWRILVDGKEEELFRTNVGFIAVELEKGFHEIALFYRTPGIILGLLCSVVGWCVFVMNCKRMDRDAKGRQNTMDR